MKGISKVNQRYVDCAIADLVQLQMTTRIFEHGKNALNKVIKVLQKFESD
jgi:hypothetical protein